MIYSDYQKAIFQSLANGWGGHMAVNAVAGSGKSKTAEIFINDYLGFGTHLVCFNSHIAVHMKDKVPSCSTYNSYGNGIVTKALKATFAEGKMKYIVEKRMNLNWPYSEKVIACVKLAKAKAVLSAEQLVSEFPDWVAYYELDPDIHVDDVVQAYNLSIKDLKFYDFSDQVYLPILLELDIPQFDNIVVDEFQDTCPIEMELLRRMFKRRLVVFGDPWQAIYSFKGTLQSSMESFVQEFQAREFPLSVCYRCSKAVVKYAQEIVPHIEPYHANPEGVVDWIKLPQNIADLGSDPVFLCRNNAPLVKQCLTFARMNIPSYVKGKEDIKDRILMILKRFKSNYDLQDQLDDYFQEREPKSKGMNLEILVETCEILKMIFEITDNRNEAIMEIEHLFDDSKPGAIPLMTIHKSKGLQFENVYILPGSSKKTELQHKLQEEERIEYVARTRAKFGLYYII